MFVMPGKDRIPRMIARRDRCKGIGTKERRFDPPLFFWPWQHPQLPSLGIQAIVGWAMPTLLFNNLRDFSPPQEATPEGVTTNVLRDSFPVTLPCQQNRRVKIDII
jgi:hypothetical protein